MSIGVGDTFPSVTLKHFTDAGLVDLPTGPLFAGKKVVLFAVPGAFTPTCSQTHLPGYVEKAEELRASGVDEIVCLAVNDPFVMKAWADQHGATGKVTMLPDGNGELARALGHTFEGTGACLGTRTKRFAMVVEDGVVTRLDVEENPGVVEKSGAAFCLSVL